MRFFGSSALRAPSPQRVVLHLALQHRARQSEHPRGAALDAQPAALAPLHRDVDRAAHRPGRGEHGRAHGHEITPVVGGSGRGTAACEAVPALRSPGWSPRIGTSGSNRPWSVVRPSPAAALRSSGHPRIRSADNPECVLSRGFPTRARHRASFLADTRRRRGHDRCSSRARQGHRAARGGERGDDADGGAG